MTRSDLLTGASADALLVPASGSPSPQGAGVGKGGSAALSQGSPHPAVRAADVFAGLTRGTPLAIDLDAYSRDASLQASGPPSEAARQHRRAAALEPFGAVQASPAQARAGYALAPGGVALVPVIGTLGPSRYWCWTTYEEVVSATAAAVADPSVAAVLLVVDSPGGYVVGCADAAAALRELSGKGKPIGAYAQDLAASAAYWLAGATGRVSCSSTGLVGSVGCLILHVEMAAALADWGITANVIRSAPRKAEANFVEPLTDAARAQLQAEVSDAAALFVAAVASARGLADTAVTATEGACLTAGQALSAGFVDAIETPGQALSALLPAAAAGAGAKAQTNPARPAPAGAEPTPSTGAGGPFVPRKPAAGRAGTSPQRLKAQPSKHGTTQRRAAVDEEEKAARRDEIAGIVAEEAADDAAKAAQYDRIAEVVNRAAPVPDDQPAETDDSDESAEAKAAKAVAAARAEDAKALALPEAKGREEAVLSLRAKGLSAADIQTTLKALTPQGFRAARASAAGQTLGADGGDKTEKTSGLVAAAKRRADAKQNRKA